MGVTSAAAVCACLMTSPSPLNVRCKDHNQVPPYKSYKYILDAVVDCLHPNQISNFEYTLRFWLEYVAASFDLQDAKDKEDCVIEVGSPSSAESHLLPGHVVKQ
ncbi:unnamed protein product, partial [Candidula unifasciata]